MLDCHWMKQLRELAYDIEDSIDKLLIKSGCRFKQESYGSNLLQEFKNRIVDLQYLGKQFGRLKVGFADLVPSDVTLDLEDTTPEKIMHVDEIPCGEKPCVVGFGGPESEIVPRLIDDEKELKVVSVLGPGGLGKTTLAREVFKKQRSQFDCGAIVYVGRYPSIDDTRMDVARQVMPNSLVPCDKKVITKKLREFLYTKRYLIVIDDIWTISSWNSITCAFPENNLGSRILATTEAEKLAKFCCVKPIDFIFVLKPLADCDSRLLLLSRMSFSEEDCQNYRNILKSALKVCGGNPLAVVVTAGLLATKAGQPWVLENTILSMTKQDYGPQEVTKILDMSYSDLPLHLKSCFLYLSTFPENCTILKDRLIRRWIAEGFIPLRKGESLWSVGKSYFKELARRGLIQLVLNDINDEIGCTIHNIIHEFIRSLSMEENFVTVGEHLSSISYPCDTVRRFTHDCSKQYESGVLSSMTVQLSKVRSLAVSGNTNKQLSDVSTFKLVRVLDLEGAMGLRKRQLRSIRSLVLLRYLSLRGTDAYQPPREMKALQHLETVDLR
ncbi:disease resistance protein RGA5 [Setaria viridis]|uniref:disease resistance protein RGA5 n=1 Tax=Setaria viridis TaxID=4556 RepID=UPI003B3AF88F